MLNLIAQASLSEPQNWTTVGLLATLIAAVVWYMRHTVSVTLPKLSEDYRQSIEKTVHEHSGEVILLANKHEAVVSAQAARHEAALDRTCRAFEAACDSWKEDSKRQRNHTDQQLEAERVRCEVMIHALAERLSKHELESGPAIQELLARIKRHEGNK